METLLPLALLGLRNWSGASGEELGTDDVRADASTAVDDTFDNK